MRSILKHSNRISFFELWAPFIKVVPQKYKGAILQRELEWSQSLLKGMLYLWTLWFFGLLFFSDLQKEPMLRNSYISIRIGVIIFSSLMLLILNKKKISRSMLSLISIMLGGVYLGGYTAFSFYSLPIRTSWLSILPSAFALTTPKSGKNAVTIYIFQLVIALFTFNQKINSIYIVSDILFGFVLIGGGLITKKFWINSIILMLDQEESQRAAFQKEIRILEAIESFIPKGIRYKIKKELAVGKKSISEIIEDMLEPVEQHLSILYSDFRNYSERSSSLEFVRTELINSSRPIIEQSENYNAIVQNKGDSVFAAFLGSRKEINVAQALLAGLESAKSEIERVKVQGRNVPDRYMIVTSGIAVFCSLGNKSRQEFTIAGKPANLAARLDEITKNEMLRAEICKYPSVLFDYETKNVIRASGLALEYEEIDLIKANISVRSYVEERRVYLLRSSRKNIFLLEKFISSLNMQKEAA